MLALNISLGTYNRLIEGPHTCHSTVNGRIITFQVNYTQNFSVHFAKDIFQSPELLLPDLKSLCQIELELLLQALQTPHLI